MPTITVDQAKLVLNSFAAIFQNNLVSKDLVTWKKFDGEMNDRNGLTVVEQVVPDYSTTITTDNVADLTAGVQNTTFGSEQYRLRTVIGSSMGWGDFQKIRDIGAARESEALKAAALRLATDIDAYILRFAALASNNWVGGSSGSGPISEWDTIASGYTRLKEEGVEDEGLRAVLSYQDKQALGSDIVANTNNGSMTNFGDGIYRSGFTGEVAGIPTLFTQQLPSFTAGTRATAGALTAGTAQSATTYEQVAISPAPGQFKTQLLSINLGGATATVVDGETFTIAGVYAWDNRAKKALNYLQEFRVVGDATATASVASVRVYPALITSGPYQTIAQAPANTAVVTFKGAPSSVFQPRFIANKDAIVVNTADLIMPATGTASRKSLTKIPLSVRMWQNSVFNTGEHQIRFDVALQPNIRADARRRVVRLNGTNPA